MKKTDTKSGPGRRCRDRSVLEKFDRAISGGIWSQILLLATCIIIVLTFFALFTVLGKFRLTDGEWDNQLWAVYNFFSDPGHQMEATGLGNRLWAIAISLFGTFLLSGVLISTLSNVIERRVETVRTGRMTYPNIRNHYVIIGFSELTVSIIDELNRSNPTARIILTSGTEAERVRHAIQSALPAHVEERVLIYFGNIESEEELARTNIDRAIEVYILGDEGTYGRDVKNIATVHRVSALRGKPSGKIPLPVYVQFDSIPSYSNIQKMNLQDAVCSTNGEPNLFFRPFNLYENWARLLWSFYSTDIGNHYDALDFRPIRIVTDEAGKSHVPNRDFVHLVIVGFNRMGRSLLLEALRLCHYANYDDRQPSEQRIRTQITVVDKGLASMLDYFKAQFPYIDSQIEDIEIEYRSDDICSTAMRQALTDWSADPHRMLTVAICMGDPDLSLSLGLNLPVEVYQSEARILVRQEFANDDLAQVIGAGKEKDGGRKKKFRNVKMFGMHNMGLKKSLIDDKLAGYISYVYDRCHQEQALSLSDVLHELYEAYANKSINPDRFTRISGEAERGWDCLDEPLRWANRYQLDAYGIFCSTLGYGIRQRECSLTAATQGIRSLTPPADALYLLKRMEKYRWNAERSVAGWKRSDERDNEFFLHNLIMPFSELERRHPEQVCKDSDVINNIPCILLLGGYELYRKE